LALRVYFLACLCPFHSITSGKQTTVKHHSNSSLPWDLDLNKTDNIKSATLSTGETPIQKEKLTNGVSKTALGGSQTSNIFRDIVGNSAPAVETQKERLTNGVNAATPISQPNKMPPPFNMFGNTPQPAVESLDKADKFMGIPPPAPANFTEERRKQYVTLYRIRSLDLSFQKHITNLTELKPGDVEHAARFYTETHEKIVAAGGLPLEGLQGSKRKLSGDETLDEW
jgi:hypothetical protein